MTLTYEGQYNHAPSKTHEHFTDEHKWNKIYFRWSELKACIASDFSVLHASSFVLDVRAGGVFTDTTGKSSVKYEKKESTICLYIYYISMKYTILYLINNIVSIFVFYNLPICETKSSLKSRSYTTERPSSNKRTFLMCGRFTFI